MVNDGSSDETATIASQFAVEDSRIRVVSQAHQGVCAARNQGISLAQFDWLLFLDSDDWISPQHLEKMTGAIALDPNLDAVHCGWVRVTPEGQPLSEDYCQQSGDLFAKFARTCAFAIHACIIRRSLVEAVGKFDTSLRTCEDWDLWQRIARTGARFGAVKEVLAYYRMRPDSVSIDGAQFLTDALRVMTRGHSPDPRVSNPKPAHANGQPVEQLAEAKFHGICWSAGLMLSAGKDPLSLLEKVREEQDPALEPYLVAYAIFYAAIIPSCQSFSAWEQLWFGLENWITQFLVALEKQSMTRGLARRSQFILERLILEHSKFTSVFTVGKTHAVRLEVTEPIVDIAPPASVERLYCVVVIEGTELGRLELPVCDGLVTGWVLKDAIASQFAWQILGRFFEQTVYAANHPNAHDEIGWTVFLQQVWGRPDWESDRFYDPEAVEEAVTRKLGNSSFLVVDISEELADIEVTLPELDTILTVGGVALGVVTVPVKKNLVTAQTLRVALTTASGFELCRACVREGIIGKPLNDPTPLRSRLEQAAMAQAQLPVWFATPGSAAVVGSGLVSPNTVVLGRRIGFNGSASRRAILPKATARELVEMAQVAGERVMQLPPPGEQPERVIYTPELIGNPSGHLTSSSAVQSAVVQATVYGRAHFETLFSTRPDPWKYTSPYEQTKYEQTLSLLPSARIDKALELACAEGHFTIQLAPKVGSLIAADISQVALERTAERCSHLKNISFQQLDITKDLLPAHFELTGLRQVVD